MKYRCSTFLILTLAGSMVACREENLASKLSRVTAADGRYISWHEHLVDDEAISGIALRGSDPHQWHSITLAEGTEAGAAEDVSIGDINGDSYPDIVAACELAHLIYFIL